MTEHATGFRTKKLRDFTLAKRAMKQLMSQDAWMNAKTTKHLQAAWRHINEACTIFYHDSEITEEDLQ